jgi:YidC/Oxa1 family membrane protein insertase
VDKRSISAMLLCLGIFLGWMWLQPRIWPQQKPAAPIKKPDAAVAPLKPVTPAVTPTKTELTTPAGEAPKYPEKPPIELVSKDLVVVFTNKGAGVERITLRYPGEKDEVPILRKYEARWPHLAIRHVGGLDEIEKLPWEVVEQKSDSVEFRFRLRNGIEITKVFTVDKDRHTVVMDLRLDNKNAVPEGKTEPPDQAMQLEVLAFNGLDPDNAYRYEQYLTAVYRYDGQLKMKPLAEIQKGEGKMVDALKLPEGPERNNEVKSVGESYFKVERGRKEWFGVKNRFFTALLLPDGAALDVLDHYAFRALPADAVKAAEGRANIVASAVTNEFKVGGQRKVMQFTLYAGPLQKDTLKELSAGAEDLAGYTGGCFPFAFVVKPAAAMILETLKITSRMLHNMGLGIIVTTLLIRLCLFPLSLKSQRNAMQMQLLSPKIQALKARYKDDQQKYGVEQMRLFKENKVNPVAGCLPLFIQMPIFIGMYSVFEMSIDLRQAGFFGWMKDLSQPDRMIGPWTPVVIPLLITDLRIDALNLLPILMTITWFLQAYFTPRSPDPQMAQQQKMMMWMPIVFGLTCYGLASGLSLYFLANSLLSMGEQKIIKKYILKIPPGGPGNPPAAGLASK